MSEMYDAPDRPTLEARLAEAEETLRAIRSGEVDAVVVDGANGAQVFTLRSADQPYRQLVEQMREGALMLTSAGDVLYANRRFAALVGEPLERVIGSSVLGYFGDDGRRVLAELTEAGGGHRRTALATAGGRRLDVYLSLTTRVSDGVEQRSLIVADVSELLDAQSGRRRAEVESQAKDEFMAMLAHELRNPLGAIASAVQVLEAMPSTDALQVRAHQVIGRQVRQLARLLDDLLDLGRATTGKIALARRTIDLSELTRHALGELLGARTDRTLDIDMESAWVHADPVRLEQIIGNLVSNAVKYTPAGGRIRVSLRADGAHAVLTVEDDGFGMASDLLPRVFDLFVQGDRTIDRSQGGLGIGLTLVRRLVELHGGEISACSEGPGRGSTFTVRLPSARPPAAAQKAVEPQTAGPGCRVLVVEDNDDVREMLRATLELDGHEVIPARDGPEGLSKLEAAGVDMALVDLGLPGMDGYQLARRLREQNPQLPLIALSGYGLSEDRERSRQAGFARHLVKPADPALLRRTIAEVVGPRGEAAP